MRPLAVILLLSSVLAASEPEEKPGEASHQLVLLLSEVQVPTEKDVAAAVSSAFKATRVVDHDKLRETKGPAFVLVPIQPGTILIAMKSRDFSIATLPAPLFNEGDAKQQENEAVAAAMRKHKCVIVVRANHADKAKSQAELNAAYDDLGKLSVALGAKNILAVYVYEAHSFHVADEAIRKKFGGKGLLQQLGTNVPFNRMDVLVGDFELEAAMKEARRTLPEFVAAFHAKKGELFQVKVMLGGGERVEHIWMNVTKIDDKTIEGKLDNKPFYLNKMQGDVVSAPLSKVSDWLFVRDGDFVGGRTVRILLERQKKEREQSEKKDK